MIDSAQRAVRPRGLCECIAMLSSSERAWTADTFDPAFLFAVSYADLREAVAVGREVRAALPKDKDIQRRAAECIRTVRDDVQARFENWQPTEQQRKHPH